ncbi:MAG: gliding motility-associated C-terminal domain-containing protein [Rhizobacter sp.]|nr:gliding motility-associated C-terminal domain-containing protein [Ferruginibacter sp.]
MRKFLLALIFLPLSAFAQKDTSFWFAAPDIVEFLTGTPHDKPILLRLTSFGTAANVIISIPANPSFTPINTTISANSTITVDLSNWAGLVENSAANIIANKGVLIRSSADITAYYEVVSTCNCNPELFALKGRSALGNEFIISSQKEWPIDTVRFPTARSAFNIVATENNTTVTINPSQPLISRPAGLPFSIILNKGQSFSNQGLYRNGPSLLNGSIITADKPISVTASEDLLMADGPCADLAGDQLIPTAIWGNEFVVIRGALTNKDKAVITAMANGTTIFLDGNATPAATINRGQSYEFNFISPTAYIKTNNKVSVYHYTGINCEIGSAVIPKINCTGSQDVAITRSIDEDAVIFIVTRQGNQSAFTVNGSNAVITAADFLPVAGSAGSYVYCKKNMNGLMSTGNATRFINAAGKFSLGFLNGATPTQYSGCRYGYFSDFKSSSVTSSQREICRLDSTQLNAFGGISYQWSPATGLSSTVIANPKASPAVTTDYKVIITTAEGCIDSAFVKVLVNNCDAAPIDCSDWLHTPSQPSWVNVGDIDVAGNQLTVEALINIKGLAPGGVIEGQDVVSKHSTFTDANYLLRSTHAEITTTSGFFSTPESCDLEMNKTYHVAMVYNGSTLKYYRNGFLFSQLPVTGNMIQNNVPTGIGFLSTFVNPENFIGFINNVRIWNVARSQQDIRGNMNSTLPNPAAQTGLVANYIFDNLLNKQGNTAFNGSLVGSAVINQVNPNCTFIVDSCQVIPVDSVIVNDYTPVLSLDICKNNITVESAAEFNVGDTVLMIQMKGAVIDSTNTAAFGNITNYKNAGNYEYNYVKSKTGNVIELRNKLIRQYDLPDGKVQLVRVPYYTNAVFNEVLTCAPWDGRKGGVLAINVANTLTLNANIDISRKGFKGGQPVQNSNYVCNVDSFFVVNNNGAYAAAKGEGIVNSNRLYARGKMANGGGGGNSTNSGGAGGGNAGIGGAGGKQFVHVVPVCNTNYINGGIGGIGLQYNNVANKIFLGGGGGAGHDNELQTAPAGNGGGIAIISANSIVPNSNKIISNGGTPVNVTPGTQEDGRSGGGGGGTVLINYTAALSTPLQVEVQGGNGDFTTASMPATSVHGPGGGGGGGIVWINKPTFETNLGRTLTGGVNGVNINLGNNAWGAAPGTPGSSLNNLVLPITTIPFKANIDSVRFSPDPTACRAFDFDGFGYTNTHPVATWQWYFGDGGTANTQNASHTYATAGTFDVKLVITDINGCKDSITRPVNINAINVFAGNDASYCSNGTVTHTLTGSGGGNTFNWQPAALLDNNAIASPTASITATTKFYLTKTDPLGCNAIDSVVITVNPVPIVTSFADTAFCANTGLTLNAAGAATYSWSPATSVSNPSVANPTFIGTTDQTLTVTGTNTQGCSASSSFDVTIKPLPVISTIPDSTICNTQSITLTTAGAQTYSWSPPNNLSDPNIANPVFSGAAGNTYTVTGTAANGCSNTAVVVITTRVPGVFNTPPDAAVCINSAVTLNGNNGTGVTYLWSPAATVSNPSVINPVTTPTATGTATYAVLISETVCNSSRSFNVNVTVNALPNVNASRSNDLDCTVRTSNLTATGAAQYTWTPVTTLSNSTGANPIASPTADTKYIVTGTDVNGCKNKDSVIVLVKGTNGRFDIPNSFTPNGDGKNDCFSVKHWGDATSFQFMIFNRWGEKVFETNNVNQCWDGRYKGQPADIGGYVYYIKSRNLCGEMIKKGSVVLIR